MLNIVLVNPQIPQNTGTIGRLCVNANLKLHIVKPCLFDFSDKALKRAGLDYWPKLKLKIWENIDEFLCDNLKFKERFFFASTKATKFYSQAKFKINDFIFFGSESKGLDQKIMLLNEKNKIKIPMGNDGRSLNLAISVGIIAYEALRQNNFEW